MITFYTLTFHLKMKNLAFLPPHQKKPFVSPAVYPVPLGPRYAVLKGASAVQA